MAGRKVFEANEILTASDVNSFLMDQSVMVFADEAARTTAIPTPTAGMVAFLQDNASIASYSGSAWVAIGLDGIRVYETESARDAGIPAPTGGIVVFVTDIAQLQFYDGSAWKQVGAGAAGGGFETSFLLMGA
jgi:hypothetical protein